MKLTDITVRGLGQVFLFAGIGFALLSSLGVDSGVSDTLFLPTLVIGGILTLVGIFGIDKEIQKFIAKEQTKVVYRKQPK